ncbi:MAG: glycoside hydrolase 43 family protein [Staphylococcus sp.]|nr:glycoside hydrolase 43 family protein [Staphylococcus sp.]
MRIKSFIPAMIAIAVSLSATSIARADNPQWGDLGDGTFANPVLNADYSDPDIIRVGDKFYMTCSEFHFMGMPILESDDMVNWHIIGNVYDSMDFPGYDAMTKYAEGTWAPALRYHDGKFWIFVCTPEEGLLMTTAENPAGPWTPFHVVKAVAKWEDPCPFWDEDGSAYLVRSRHRAGPIIIHRMSPDGRTLLDEGTKVYHGPVAEGPKMFRKDGYYYISIPEGGVSKGWQTILRSKDVYGPYEAKRVLEKGSTDTNGPHQGSLVDTPDGDWWFYHFQSAGVRGRVLHLQPVSWAEDGYPVIGTDYDGNGVGEPMKICKKPFASQTQAHTPQASDDFSAPQPGLQWQTNHNPVPGMVSTTEREGWLTIKPIHASWLRLARNQLTQKIMGYRSEAEIKLDFSAMKPGDRSGLACLGKSFNGAGVMVDPTDGKPCLYVERDSLIEVSVPLTGKIEPAEVTLRLSIDAPANSFAYSYSLDGKDFRPLGEPFEMKEGFWKGVRTGIYAYTTSPDDSAAGQTAFDYFHYTHDGPRQAHE